MPEHSRITRNRREFLCDAFCSFGGLAFAQMLMREDARAATLNPLAPKAPDMPHKARAKSVIFLFMAGGPSHIETFDPKPLLNQLSGQKRPAEFGEAKYQFISSDARSEEHTSELQSPCNLVCRLLLEKKKKRKNYIACLSTTR